MEQDVFQLPQSIDSAPVTESLVLFSTIMPAELQLGQQDPLSAAAEGWPQSGLALKDSFPDHGTEQGIAQGKSYNAVRHARLARRIAIRLKEQIPATA